VPDGGQYQTDPLFWIMEIVQNAVWKLGLAVFAQTASL
jgi:hypothetical protein